MRLTADAIGPDELERLRSHYPRAFSRPPLKRLRDGALWLGLIVFVGFCLVRFEATPTRIINGLSELGAIAIDMFPPSFGAAPGRLFWALAESLSMALVGTLIAALVAVPFGILGARNIIPQWLFHFTLRRHFDAIRGIDPLVWALVYVRAIGLGPLAGTLAIATSDTGTLSKLYAEAIETAEQRQAEGIAATGAPRSIIVRLGILPQVLPVMLANALYMFESNTRSATILGIVGAGGIGFELSDRIRAHRWDEVSMIILMIVVTVALIDGMSHAIRKRFIEGGQNRPIVTNR